MEDGRSHTLEEIGLRHGVTRERVRQVLLRCRRTVRYQLSRAERGNVDRPLRHLGHALRPLTHDETSLLSPDRTAQVVVHHLDHLDLHVGAHLVEGLARENKDRGVTVTIHAAAKTLLCDLLAEERWQRVLHGRLADLLRDVRFPGGERAYTPEELGLLARCSAPASPVTGRGSTAATSATRWPTTPRRRGASCNTWRPTPPCGRTRNSRWRFLRT
ncbi:sigma factor-like helix-turn-helix DNA-binding protein [Deinococcus planocerae]|uniref:sigma factor-like helix-turn-helix DNA-binding protein n=1 Tax=Deinococcus planocerae TaxID=1737569 RepID=UPI0011AFAB47